MSELKPCPFCGPGKSVCEVANQGRRWQIVCGACGSASGLCRTVDRAIALWNTRADSIAVAAAVQAEREAIKAHIGDDDFQPDLRIDRDDSDRRSAWGRGVFDVMEYIDSRSQSHAVDVIGVVREYVEAERALERPHRIEDREELVNEAARKYLALAALVPGAAKGEGEGR